MVPEALVNGGNHPFFLALVCKLGADVSQAAVRIAVDGVKASALKGGDDDAAVFLVHGDVHRILAADVNGIQMFQGSILLNLIAGYQGQISMDAVEIFLFQIQTLVAGIILCKKTLFLLPFSIGKNFIDHQSPASCIALLGGSASDISILHNGVPAPFYCHVFHIFLIGLL